jgi:hypothetical protein
MDVGKWKISVNSFTTTKFLHTILYVTGSFYFSFLRVVNAINIYVFCRNAVNNSWFSSQWIRFPLTSVS